MSYAHARMLCPHRDDFHTTRCMTGKQNAALVEGQESVVGDSPSWKPTGIRPPR